MERYLTRQFMFSWDSGNPFTNQGTAGIVIDFKEACAG